MSYPRRIHGIDFSGAADAGKCIWIASGTIDSGRLHIDACRRADTLPGSSHERDVCLAALCSLIMAEKACAVGLDFPFSLPKDLIQTRSWTGFIRSFPNRYPTPRRFRAACVRAANDRERKRATDIECRAPFSPYNLRLYRQTYHGIRDVLRPLVQKGQVCVLPMQRAQSGKPWLLEICPASTLKRLDLYVPYKGATSAHRRARRRILAGLQRENGLSLAPVLRPVLIGEPGGDALDSVIAAYAAYRAVLRPGLLSAPAVGVYALEGLIYA
ncbi:MAG TPA: DUF429 domain-containing protein [Anaerolineae bacterium]|nr:DUF429 domain-containing protein [Anaerolineae bacterium]